MDCDKLTFQELLDCLANDLRMHIIPKIMHGIWSITQIGVRPICQHNFGNNKILKESRIILE